MKRPLLTERDIIDRAEARRWKNSSWTWAYRLQRRSMNLWFLIFLLFASLLALLPIGILLVARYGRP